MGIAVTEYVSVAERALALGCHVPDQIAVLPENFGNAKHRGDLRFGAEAATLKKLLRNSDIPVSDVLPVGDQVPSIHNKHFEWAPLLFVSGALMSSNPAAVSVALGIIANYATDYFKGMVGRKVVFRIVVEKHGDHSCKMVTYDGNAEGIAALADVITRISNE